MLENAVFWIFLFLFCFSLLKYTYYYNYRSHISLQVVKLAKSAGVGDHFSLPFTPPRWALSSARMGFPITVMPMILNCFCLSLLRTPRSRRGSRTVSLNLAKTELMVFPAKQVLHHNINIKIDSLSLVLSKTARNLWVIIDDQLTFTDHIASVSRSCCFALYNIRKIRPYLTQYDTQLLVQTLVSSRLEYCNALLTGLPACVVKPLQMIQNAAARLVFNQPKRAHVTPLFIALSLTVLSLVRRFGPKRLLND